VTDRIDSPNRANNFLPWRAPTTCLSDTPITTAVPDAYDQTSSHLFLALESLMPYLAPHFDPDVFVSYSHGDPIAGDAPLRDWTRALIHRLRVGLHALKTEFDGLDIWMDPEIDPTAYLTPELKAKAGACGVLMIVMSERYLKSSWCGDELKWFREQFQGRANEGGRVFVIRAQRTEEHLWPDFLRDAGGHALIGFPFYDPESGDPWGFQLREPGDDYFKELTKPAKPPPMAGRKQEVRQLRE
jgi:hypothetical protein